MTIKGFITSFLNNILCTLCVLSGIQFLENIFIAFTIIMFFILGIVVFAIIVNEDDPDTQKYLKEFGKKRQFKKLNLLNKFLDSAFLAILFGFGYWWMGALWFLMHFVYCFIMDSYIKKAEEATDSHEND